MKKPISPYKIIHVTDGFLSLKERAPNLSGVGGKLTQGMILAGHQVVEFPYRVLGRGLFRSYRTASGRRRLEKLLREQIERFRPDILILGHAYCFSPSYLASLKQSFLGLKIISWNQDAIDEGDNLTNIRQRLEVADKSFVTTDPEYLMRLYPALREFERRFAYMPIPVDRSVETGRNFEKERAGFDIFLSAGAGDQERLIAGETISPNALLQRLRAGLPEYVSYGLAGVGDKRPLYGSAYRELTENSLIGLNLSRPGNASLYSSDRIAHIVGNGMLCAIERESGFERFLGEEGGLYFSSVDELIDGLKFHILNPKERMRRARMGYENYAFTSRRVAEILLGDARL